MFASAIGAEWQSSNVGLDDVRLGNCCWSAKTKKASISAKQVPLIIGRNSTDRSFDILNARDMPEAELGPLILSIWNTRVSSVRQRFAHCRTVVLLKSNDLLENAVFEVETLRYEPDRFTWRWNKNNNLVGFDDQNVHRLTWQPGSGQFTIKEDVPAHKIAFRVREPGALSRQATLDALGFSQDWVTIVPNDD